MQTVQTVQTVNPMADQGFIERALKSERRTLPIVLEMTIAHNINCSTIMQEKFILKEEDESGGDDSQLGYA